MSLQAQSRRTSSEWHIPLSSQQRQGRALNAVASLLRNTLRVPNIYLKVGWPKLDRKKLDLMAVDRAGSGDVHVVFIHLDPSPAASTATLSAIKKMPAHFMYLATLFPALEIDPCHASYFSRDGIGRVGIIGIHEQEDSSPTATVLQPPERFLMPREVMDNITRFTFKHRPDFDVKI